MAILPPINPAIPRCPRCRATDVIKKGRRNTRHETRQRWGCNRCGYTFTNLVTKHSPYPVKVIMEAICRYNLGYSARETVRYFTRRFRIAVPEKTNFQRMLRPSAPRLYLCGAGIQGGLSPFQGLWASAARISRFESWDPRLKVLLAAHVTYLTPQ
jgi:hypothetical protein